MSWPLAKLGDIAEFVNGFAFKPSHWEESGKKIIRIQNLTDAAKPYNRTSLEVPEKYIVRAGDILVSWSATLDVFEWSDEEALLNQHIFKVVPNYALVDKAYFKFAIKNAIESMLQFTRGSTMKHINRGDFLSTEIPPSHHSPSKSVSPPSSTKPMQSAASASKPSSSPTTSSAPSSWICLATR